MVGTWCQIPATGEDDYKFKPRINYADWHKNLWVKSLNNGLNWVDSFDSGRLASQWFKGVEGSCHLATEPHCQIHKELPASDKRQ